MELSTQTSRTFENATMHTKQSKLKIITGKLWLKSKNNSTAKAERNDLKKSNILTDAYVLLKFLNDEIQSVQNDLLLQEYEVMIVKLEKIIGWIEDQPE